MTHLQGRSLKTTYFTIRLESQPNFAFTSQHNVRFIRIWSQILDAPSIPYPPPEPTSARGSDKHLVTNQLLITIEKLGRQQCLQFLAHFPD